MELSQLNLFLRVAEEGSLARAAQRLFTSQASASAHLKRLEDELGLRLFERTARGMRLTEAGEAIHAKAASLVRGASEIQEAARQMVAGEQVGTFRIGLNTDPGFLRIQAIVRHLQTHHPGMRLEILENESYRIREDLESGLLDAGYLYGLCNHPSVACEVQHRMTFRFVAPAPWAPRIRGAGLVELAQLPWLWMPPHCSLHGCITAFFQKHGVAPRIAMTVDSEDTFMTLLAAEQGLCVLRAELAEQACREGYAVICPIGEVALHLSLAWLDRRGTEPRLRAGLEAVRRAWRAERGS